jgi:hypothetical protein
MALTEAKPDSEAINDTPVMPSLSKHAWKRPSCRLILSVMLVDEGSRAPMAQNPNRKAA